MGSEMCIRDSIELSYNDELVSLERLTNKNQVSCIVLPVGACSEF